MKTNFFGRIITLLAIALLSYGCSLDVNPELEEPCDSIATIRYNLCGVGLWGPYVLELPDGEIVQPWSTPHAEIRELPMIDGLRIRVSLQSAQRDNRYDGVVTCRALGPYTEKISRAVQITCATPLFEDIACNTRATVRNNICGNGLWGPFLLELANGEIVQPWSTANPDIARAQLSEGQQVVVNIRTTNRDNRYDSIPICLALPAYANRVGRAVQVNCLRDASGNRIATNGPATCATEVIAEDFGCATFGVWKGIWLRTSDGRYLQPLRLAADLSGMQLQHGQRLRISFSVLSQIPSHFANVEVCPTLVALPQATPIMIDCISVPSN